MLQNLILLPKIMLVAIATKKLLELITFKKNLLAVYLRFLNITFSFIYIAFADIQG